ncbi:hypothetical protein ACFLXB_02685 [Chloroflexota bacterium]
MRRAKGLRIFLIVTILTVFSVTQVFAAPSYAVGEGTITAILMETDLATAITTVEVTLEDSDGLVQNVSLDLDSAVAEGLVIPDASQIDPLVVVELEDPADPSIILASGAINNMAFVTEDDATTLSIFMVDPLAFDPLLETEYSFDLETAVYHNLLIVDETMIGTAAAFDPAIVLDSTEYGKVVSKVGSFFNTALGVDYAILQAYQDDGFGYGEIVQASWMAYLLGGDAATLDQILAAKESGDFSGIALPEGESADNWGQLRKAILTDPKQNVGQIISGKAEPLPAPTEVVPTDVPTETPAELPAASSSQPVDNGNGNNDEKTNNGKSDNTEKSNNGKANGNTKEKTNNGKKP